MTLLQITLNMISMVVFLTTVLYRKHTSYLHSNRVEKGKKCYQMKDDSRWKIQLQHLPAIKNCLRSVLGISEILAAEVVCKRTWDCR